MRITPAPAGNSSIHIPVMPDTEDHPRPCGEQIFLASRISLISGSPPPLRGTEPHYIPRVIASGITPAPAGNRKNY